CDGKCVTRAALVESTRAWQNLRLGAEVAKRQTQWTQNPPGAIPCGFKSRPRHHSNASTVHLSLASALWRYHPNPPPTSPHPLPCHGPALGVNSRGGSRSTASWFNRTISGGPTLSTITRTASYAPSRSLTPSTIGGRHVLSSP